MSKRKKINRRNLESIVFNMPVDVNNNGYMKNNYDFIRDYYSMVKDSPETTHAAMRNFIDKYLDAFIEVVESGKYDIWEK